MFWQSMYLRMGYAHRDISTAGITEKASPLSPLPCPRPGSGKECWYGENRLLLARGDERLPGEGMLLLTYLHLAAEPELTRAMLEKKVILDSLPR